MSGVIPWSAQEGGDERERGVIPLKRQRDVDGGRPERGKGRRKN